MSKKRKRWKRKRCKWNIKIGSGYDDKMREQKVVKTRIGLNESKTLKIFKSFTLTGSANIWFCFHH